MQTVALYTQSGKEKDSLLEWYIDIRHFLDYAYHLSAADITSEQQQQKKKLKSANTVKGKQSY